MERLLISLFVLCVLVVGCEGGAPSARPEGSSDSGGAAVEFKTPPPEPTEAQLKPTNTPVSPPPTPTPRSTPTIASEPTSISEEAEVPTTTEETIVSKTKETQTEPTQASLPLVVEDMVEIPAGPFTMGSDIGDAENAPAHEVDLPAYKIDRFEVTNADFAAFVETTGYTTHVEQEGSGKAWRAYAEAGRENHPVVKVTWDDAAAFCEWLGKRLPTEAEWEKAARGAEGYIFPWGNEWDATRANGKDTGLRGTAAVGSFGAGASPYGVEDMAGNVWEWTTDWYQAYPGNTVGDAYYGEQCRATRGGGWFDAEPQLTTFNRNCAIPGTTANDELGFRCAVSE